jgi:tetratricopeptide (TPR) repeat protein
MDDHDHNINCGCKEHRRGHDKSHLRDFCSRSVFCFLFVAVSIYLLRPLLVQQLMMRASTYVSYPLYEDAIRQYKKALFFGGDKSGIHVSLAYLYRSKYDIAQAKAEYFRALRLDHQNASVLFDLGMIYFMEKRYREAIGYFDSVIGLGPEYQHNAALNHISYHNSSLRMLAVCYEELDRKVEEKRVLHELLRFYPGDKTAQEKLGQIQ